MYPLPFRLPGVTPRVQLTCERGRSSRPHGVEQFRIAWVRDRNLPSGTHRRDRQRSKTLMIPFDRVETSLSFLRAIEQAEPVGLNTKGATQALGTVHRNSIGSKTPIINRQLRRNGYSPDEVYRRQRTPGGNFWRAGPKIGEAIAALESDRKILLAHLGSRSTRF